MDSLPKDKPDDLTSFAGTYPEPPQGNQPATPAVVNEPPPVPFAPEAVSAEPNPALGETSSATPEPLPSQPAQDTFTFSATGSAAQTPPLSPPPTENPFAAPAMPPQKTSSSGTGIKRILMILVAILVVAGLGFAAFTIVGKFLTSSQPKVLQYWGLWENEQLLTGLIEEYKQTHPNIDIVYTRQNPRQYRERLQAQIARGEGPDIYRFHNTWVPMLKNDLAPAGSTGYTAQEFSSTFYPVATQDLVVGGEVYGVPLMIDGLGLFYNEDLLRSAGVTPPTTWEDFRNAALTLTVKDQAGKIITAGAALGTANNIEHFSDILAVMMLQNGASLTNPSGSEAQQALAFYRLFAEQPGNVWDETLDNSIMAFASGKVAFMFAPSWQVFTVMDANPQLKFQVIPIPQLAGSSINWASYWVEGVSSKSAYKDEGWEFIKFLSEKDNLVKLYTEQAKVRPFGEPYSRVDLAQQIINEPFVGAYIRQAPTAQTFYLASRTFDNGLNDRMIKYLEDAINASARSVSAQAALQTMGQGFAQILSSYGLQAGN